MPSAACSLCGAPSDFLLTTGDRNRGVGERTFSYRRCRACRSVELADVPDDLDPYYPDDYYVLPSLDELRAAARRESYRMELLLPFAASGRLTEIGPGNGIFAVQAKDAGFDTAAIEMDGRVSDYLRTVVGIEVVQSDRPEEVLPTRPASRAIAMWHVLEHVPRPWDLLDAAGSSLEPGGALVVAMPNPDALGFRLLRERWTHLDAPRHLFLIPARALVERARAAGLQLALLTSTDRGGRYWDRFAWQQALVGPQPGRVRRVAARAGGAAIALLLAPFERRRLRGSTYTAVFVRSEGDQRSNTSTTSR
jgi:SAM-dependent methyltransferase